MSEYRFPLYTGEGKTVDIRFVGSLPLIVEMGDKLHEHTPYLSAIYHVKAGEGLLYTRIDASQMNRLFKFQRAVGEGGIRHDILFNYDPKMGKRFTHRFTLRDCTFPAYAGSVGQMLLRPEGAILRPRYYRIIDTPDATLGQIFARRFATYCYTSSTTQITYILADLEYVHRHNAFIRLAKAFPGIDIELRFQLPYEDTSEFSPIERKVAAPDYF